MKYVVTENQYEKLLQASRERHAKDLEPRIKGGILNANGHLVKYYIVVRNGESIYASYSYEDQKRMVYIMTDVNFILLDKKDQEDSVEFKIKKDIEKKSQIKEHLIPGEDYGIDEQIDYLENHKKSLFLYSNASRSLKLVNNIIHNLKQIRNSQ